MGTVHTITEDCVEARVLARVPLFEDLPEAELEYLAGSLGLRDLSHGAYMFREGDSGDCLYIIIQGELEIVKAMEAEGERLIAVRHAGDFVGELGLVNPDGLRTASIRARGDVKLWEMGRADFDALLQRQPQMAFKMVTVLGGRLTAAHNASIHDLQEKNRQLQIAYDDLKAAQAQLVEKERLERELQLAAEIQLSILPRELPQLPGYNFGAQLVPARFVGGDFYEFIPLESGKIGVVIGDVSDKGVPSAIFMAQTHAFLYAEASRILDPVEVLKRVNRHLAETNAAHLFVTVLYGILDHEQGIFTYARAGHELPLLAQLNGRTQALPWNEGQLLGILEDVILDQQSIKMPPGSTLLLYTDGMTDIRNHVGKRFGMENLENELGSLIDLPAQVVCDRLVAKLQSYQDDTLQDDDITVVAIKSEII